MNRRQFLGELATVPAIGTAAAHADSPLRTPIQSIDIIHHTHLDVGYTALPSVVRDDQVRYLDAAIDCCHAAPGFRWTVETLVELDDWWRATTATRRTALLTLIRTGQIDVMAMPFNQTPFLNALQWQEMLRWIPAPRWRSLSIRAAMQDDVNGFPRAGAKALLDHGIHHLLMGINADSGGPPFRRPDAFWWQQPDGRRLFVWLGEHYGSIMNYLAPVRDAARYRTDKESLLAAHAKLTEHLQTITARGYRFTSLILTHTHPQRYDNGHPYPSLVPFLNAWNQMGLTPSLRLTTATEAVFRMERSVGNSIPTLTGEWTDWWANGDASGPREVAASRIAKRALTAALSPVFGTMPPSAAPEVSNILRDLCLFDEHTWGASSSIAAPNSPETLGQYVEKSALAYRPMGAAQALLARRIRAHTATLPQGIYAINPTASEISGWVTPPTPDHKAPTFLKLAAHSITPLQSAPPVATASQPVIDTGNNGWPVTAAWPGMQHPLFSGGLGEFTAVTVIPPAGRKTISQLHAKFDPELRRRTFSETHASYAPAHREETSHTIRYTQQLSHPRLGPSERRLELWKAEPRARLIVKLDRLSSRDPEVLFLDFHLPQGLPLPILSCGGLPFTPYRDQLPGSCRDYFAIDGWAHFQGHDGNWLWVTRDAPLVAIGQPHVVERHQQQPAAPHRILAMIFDNCWHTNFVADSHGEMQFQFDLVWRATLDQPAALAEALATDPLIALNQPTIEKPLQLLSP